MKIGKSSQILIIANGQIQSKTRLRHYCKKADCIIAANGGSVKCYQNSIHPDFIVGDLDSVDKKVLDYFKSTEIVHIQDQNRHDLDKALGFARTLEPEIIYVLGAFGERLDHSMANLVFLQSQPFNMPVLFIDDYGILSYIHGNHDLNLTPGRTISFFSFLPVAGLSLEGFEYPLHNVDFPNGFNGLSNRIKINNSRVSIRQGSLFMYCLHENTPA